MATDTRPLSPDARTVLEGDLRERFGRVVYTHKTHEKCADLLLDRLGKVKFAQIVLAAVSTGGGATAVIDKAGVLGTLGAVVATLLSIALLILNAYTKENNLAELGQRHRKTAAELWLMREKYQYLLAALAMKERAVRDIEVEGKALLEQLHAIYKDAPSTTSAAYAKAQDALQVKQDMTFEDGEIDKMLPPELRRNRGAAPELGAPKSGDSVASISASSPPTHSQTLPGDRST